MHMISIHLIYNIARIRTHMSELIAFTFSLT